MLQRRGKVTMESKDITLLTVKDMAHKLSASVRSIWAWRDAHRIPLPVTIGGCCRWRSDLIQDWIVNGCPDLRETAALGRG
jgi:predicted DNA-binding transcriptional regulator AlpA